MPQSRRERRMAHEFRAQAFHTHERVIERNGRYGFRLVSVRCTRVTCSERDHTDNAREGNRPS